MPTKQEKLGAPRKYEELLDQRMNIKFTASMKEEILSRAKQSGVAPSEIIRRALENQGGQTSVADEIRRAVREALEEGRLSFTEGGIPIVQAREKAAASGAIVLRLNARDQRELEVLSKKLGFIEPAHMVQDLVGRALDDPKQAEEFLFAGIRAKVDAKREKEEAANAKAARKGKAA